MSFGTTLRRFCAFDALATHLGNRENNFTAIRFFLASMVLYGHSFAVADKKTSSVLVTDIYGRGNNIGYFAVNCFFFISGLLITQSFCRRQNFSEFFSARIQRIFPASIVCLFLCVFVLGPAMTDLPLFSYLSNPQTYKHLISNLLLWKLDWVLPGVFTKNNLTAINGSLWTLPTELNCYLAIGFIGLLGGLRDRWTATITLFALLGVGLFVPKALPLLGALNKQHPLVYFMIGSLCFFHARQLYLSPALLIGLVAACVVFFSSKNYNILFAVTGCYAVLVLAYRTPFLGLNRWGDFSYGMYIYAFPVQQMWAALRPKWDGYHIAPVAFACVLPLAVASWFLIEKKAIAWRRRPAPVLVS